jgi:hypothetical protein
MSEPATMSGQAESSAATPAAAMSTPAFAITSLREDSNVLLMSTLSLRNRHSSKRQVRFASSASAPKISISRLEGGTPCRILRTTSNTTTTKRHEDQAAFRQRDACLPPGAAVYREQAQHVDQRIAEHVDRVGLQRGRPRDQPCAELDEEHPGVDQQHDHQHAALVLLQRERGDLLALVRAAIIRF